RPERERLGWCGDVDCQPHSRYAAPTHVRRGGGTDGSTDPVHGEPRSSHNPSTRRAVRGAFMPAYLSPGVFGEEAPARLKAIEGVSTSTAGFVGAAERGTVPGYPLPPFALPAGVTFEFPIDRGPVLVTSFAEFARGFGAPLPLVAGETHGY